jgi:hypothetical protein
MSLVPGSYGLYHQARDRLVANEKVRAFTEERDARVRANDEWARSESADR